MSEAASLQGPLCLIFALATVAALSSLARRAGPRRRGAEWVAEGGDAGRASPHRATSLRTADAAGDAEQGGGAAGRADSHLGRAEKKEVCGGGRGTAAQRDVAGALKEAAEEAAGATAPLQGRHDLRGRGGGAAGRPPRGLEVRYEGLEVQLTSASLVSPDLPRAPPGLP